jgi:hypothetical protein
MERAARRLTLEDCLVQRNRCRSVYRKLSLPQNEVRLAGDVYLSFSPFALGVTDVAGVCPRQLVVQSASAERQPFECTAYGMSLLSGGSWLMLHVISASKQVTHLLSASELEARRADRIEGGS